MQIPESPRLTRLETAGTGGKWREMVGNGGKWREMAGNGGSRVERAGMGGDVCVFIKRTKPIGVRAGVIGVGFFSVWTSPSQGIQLHQQ